MSELANSKNPTPTTTSESTTSTADAYNPGPRPLWDYVAQVRISVDEQRELQASPVTTICLFLGPPPVDSAQWLRAANLAGVYHAKVPPRTRVWKGGIASRAIGWKPRDHKGESPTGREGGDGITTEEGRRSSGEGSTASFGQPDQRDSDEGFIYLNTAISRHSQPGLFNPEIVVPYLEKTLHWRVMKGDGTPIEPRSLEILIFANPLTYPPGNTHSVRGERRYFACLTAPRTEEKMED